MDVNYCSIRRNYKMESLLKQPNANLLRLFKVMRRKISSVLLFAGLLSVTQIVPVMSQELKPNTRYFGYFVNHKGDTIRGFILWSNKVDIQDGFEFANDPTGTKLHFGISPEDIYSFRVLDYNYEAV